MINRSRVRFPTGQCTAGLALGWLAGKAYRYGNQSPRSTQPSIPLGYVNRVQGSGCGYGGMCSLALGGR